MRPIQHIGIFVFFLFGHVFAQTTTLSFADQSKLEVSVSDSSKIPIAFQIINRGEKKDFISSLKLYKQSGEALPDIGFGSDSIQTGVVRTFSKVFKLDSFDSVVKGILLVTWGEKGSPNPIFISRSIELKPPVKLKRLGSNLPDIFIPFILGLIPVTWSSWRIYSRDVNLDEFVGPISWSSQDSWVTVFASGTGFANAILAFNLLSEQLKAGFVTQAALYAFFLYIGPLWHRMTIKVTDSKGRVYQYLIASFLTLWGTFGSIYTAWGIIQIIGSEQIEPILQSIIALAILLLAGLLVWYGVRAITYTVLKAAGKETKAPEEVLHLL